MKIKKNIQKRIAMICVIMLALVAVLFPITVFAAEDSYNTQTVEIQYDVPSTFTVEIPAYMSVDMPVMLYGTDFNVASGKYVAVSIDFASFNDNDNISMQLGGTDNYIEVGFYDNDTGSKVTRNSPNVARFVEDGTSNAQSNYFHAELANGDFAKAGSYHGTVTFIVSTKYE